VPERSGFPLPQSNLGAMNGEALTAKATITNPMGFHMRPIAAFARRAVQYAGEVVLIKDGQRVNGKSTMELLLLAAEQGTELGIEVSGSGPEAQATLVELTAILAAPAMDDEEE
jgi:phosphocarrier protein